MPELEAAVAGRADAALVTVVFGGDPRHARAVRQQIGLRAPVLFDAPMRRPGATPGATEDQPRTLRARYGIEQVPWTVVVNGDGRAVEVLSGAHDRDRFIKALDALD